MIFKSFLIVLFTLCVHAENGFRAISHPYPFVVSLQKHTNNTIFKYCSGVIVSESWVLTNAQCVDENKVKRQEIIIQAGVLNAYEFNYKFAQTRKVEKIVRRKIHRENERTGIPKDDLVMLKVDKPFIQRRNVRNAKLSETFDVTGPGEIIGWGASTYPADENQSDNLLYANLNVLDQDKCLEFYKDVKDKFCVGNSEQVACTGDAGGPFVQYDQKTGEQIVVGLASIGAVPCTAKPTLYINVAYSSYFIKNTIKNDFN